MKSVFCQSLKLVTKMRGTLRAVHDLQVFQVLKPAEMQDVFLWHTLVAELEAPELWKQLWDLRNVHSQT